MLSVTKVKANAEKGAEWKEITWKRNRIHFNEHFQGDVVDEPELGMMNTDVVFITSGIFSSSLVIYYCDVTVWLWI